MKIVVGIPCMGTIHVGTVGGLLQLQSGYKDIEFLPYMISSSLVYDARNEIIDYANKANADYLLFIDSDIVFPAAALKALLDQNKERTEQEVGGCCKWNCVFDGYYGGKK